MASTAHDVLPALLPRGGRGRRRGVPDNVGAGWDHLTTEKRGPAPPGRKQLMLLNRAPRLRQTVFAWGVRTVANTQVANTLGLD